MAKEKIQPSNVYKARGFSHAVKAGNIICVGCQAALDMDFKLVGKDDITKQAEEVYKNLQSCVEAAGAKMSDVIMMHYYLKNPDDLNKIFEVMPKYFTERPFPAIGCLKIEAFTVPGVLFEVDAIVVKE
jgi:enamine deaminase RidA (YjgF/YER057c/UK114 family)